MSSIAVHCYSCQKEYQPVQYANILMRTSFDFCSNKCKEAFFKMVQTLDDDNKVENQSFEVNRSAPMPIPIPKKIKHIKNSRSMVVETVLQTMKNGNKK